MPIGNNPASDQLNFMAGQVAIQLRNAALAAQNLANYITGLGLDGLATAGFDADDAAAFLAAVGDGGIGQLTGVFFGTATLATPVNFSALLQELAGPA